MAGPAWVPFYGGALLHMCGEQCSLYNCRCHSTARNRLFLHAHVECVFEKHPLAVPPRGHMSDCCNQLHIFRMPDNSDGDHPRHEGLAQPSLLQHHVGPLHGRQHMLSSPHQFLDVVGAVVHAWVSTCIFLFIKKPRSRMTGKCLRHALGDSRYQPNALPIY